MLRSRILLNLIPIFAILTGGGAFALYLFSRMEDNVSRTVEDNYKSDAAAQSMSVTLARMDTALQRSRAEEKTAARQLFDANAGLFQESLESQFTNQAIAQQMNTLLQLRTNLLAMRASAETVFGPGGGHPDSRSFYDREVIPRTLAISLLLDRIREATRENIMATGKSIQRINRTITSLLIIGIVIALLASGYASFKLGKAIMKPIRTLTDAAREIGEGNLDLRVPVLSQDELGELAVSFNKMAAQLNTYRQSTTDQIIRLHRTMEAALTSFSDPVFIMDTQGHVELQNRAAQSLSAQLALEGALPPRLATATADVLRTSRDFLPDSFDEVLTLRVNGGEKAFLPRIHLMRETDARPVGVAVVLHDVTRFRLLDDAKTNLVATVSHELKTPLTSVRMVLHLLSEKSLGPLNKKQDELVETARKDSERLIRILDELLDIARLEAGAASLTRESVRPADLVQSIVDEARRPAAEAGVRLSTTVEPDLPTVLVDRQKIGYVFHNFITNAIKHSPRGGLIRVTATGAADRSVQFCVCDQGPGIAPEYQGRIFDRFFRAPGQAKQGAGLGLTIAREVVVAHGGRVGVRSQVGQGSEFYFVLDGEAAEN
jgi:signal transduction histidine kinase/HAMP domain-containing protein